MDARKINMKALNEGISKGNYFITGVTKEGEIVLSIISEAEKQCVNNILKKDIGKEEKLRLVKKLMSFQGRPANELMQIYLQETVSKEEYCLGNGLRIK